MKKLSSSKESQKKITSKSKVSSTASAKSPRKKIRRSSSHSNKRKTTSVSAEASNIDYDSLSHSLIPRETDVVEEIKEDATHISSKAPGEAYAPGEYAPQSTFDYAHELIPTSSPQPRFSRTTLWLGVISFTALITVFWGCALKNQFTYLSTSSSADQTLLNQTKTSWKNAFSDTPSSTPSASSTPVNPTTSSTLPTIFNIEAAENGSTVLSPDSETILNSINPARFDKVDSYSKMTSFSSTTYGLAWSESNNEKPYTAFAAIIKKAPAGSNAQESWVMSKKISLPLPIVPWNMDGVKIEHTAYADIFGTGNSVWMISYFITEAPRPAVGSKGHRYLLFISPETGAILKTYELDQVSQALVEKTCSTELYTSTGSSNTSSGLAAVRTCYTKRTCTETSPLPPDVDCTPERTIEFLTWNQAKKTIEISPLSEGFLKKINSLSASPSTTASTTATSTSANPASPLPASKPRIR